MTIKDMAERPAWEIALSLNKDRIASKESISDSFDLRSSELKRELGDDKYKQMAGMVAYVNSMMLDFDKAQKYSMIEHKKESLIELQENAMLYGRSDVVMKLDEHGRKKGIDGLIINHEDMQDFLTCHALPHFRVYRPDKREEYRMDDEVYSRLMSYIDMDEKEALVKALDILDSAGNDNLPRKLLFAKKLGDRDKIDRYGKEFYKRITAPRESIGRLLSERALLLNKGNISRIQEGDYNRAFPLASHIYLVDDGLEKMVWKENLKLYTDFSRFDGYNAEKERLEELDHPGIVKLRDTFREKDFEFLELEYAEGGSLDKYQSLQRWEALEIGMVLCDVLGYLHSKDVLYMDLKDKNIMYNRDKALREGTVKNSIKLLDFGMSQKVRGLNEDSVLTTLMSTPRYVTPETSAFRAYKSTDIFQLGVLLYEMVSDKHPFASEDITYQKGDEFRESELIQYGLAVRYGDYKGSGDRLDGLMQQMMSKDPSARPSLDYVRNSLKSEYDIVKSEKQEVRRWKKQEEHFISDDSRYSTRDISMS